MQIVGEVRFPDNKNILQIVEYVIKTSEETTPMKIVKKRIRNEINRCIDIQLTREE